MATKSTKGLVLIALIAGLIAPQVAFGEVVWGTGVTLPSSPVYGQSNPYIYTDGAFYSSFTVDSLEIGSRHWNCGGTQHNVGYITIANASTSEVYATSSVFNQYCGGWDNPYNLSVSFAGETVPALTIVEIQIHYTTWVGDNGYGGFEMQGNTLPTIDIIYPADNATTTTLGITPNFSVINTVIGSTATMLNAYPVLQIPSAQNIQTIVKNETGNNVIIYDTFSFTPQPYYVYANALDINGDIIGTSTPITLWVETIPDTTTSTAYSACDSDETFTGRWFCRSMVFLFSPSQAVLNSFTRLTDRAKNAPPFNLLTEVSDALSFEATTTEQAVSSSTLEAFSGIFSPARTGIKVALWLLFAFWLIRAIRHIQT